MTDLSFYYKVSSSLKCVNIFSKRSLTKVTSSPTTGTDSIHFWIWRCDDLFTSKASNLLNWTQNEEKTKTEKSKTQRGSFPFLPCRCQFHTKNPLRVVVLSNICIFNCWWNNQALLDNLCNWNWLNRSDQK